MINKLEDEAIKADAHQEEQIDVQAQQADVQREETLENEEFAQSSDETQHERVKELENQMTRLSADFANFKKRSEREKADIYKYASEDLIKAILPIIDDYDRAIDHYEEEKSDAFGQGVNLIFRKLIEVLESKGVKEIKALGEEFDPNFHHAVEMSKNEEYESGKVCDVLLKAVAGGPPAGGVCRGR